MWYVAIELRWRKQNEINLQMNANVDRALMRFEANKWILDVCNGDLLPLLLTVQ